jgi:hypothetical protein
MLPRNLNIVVMMAMIIGAVGSGTYARSILLDREPTAIVTQPDDPFAVGKIIRDPETFRYPTRQGFVTKVVGQPGTDKFRELGGELAEYWRRSQSSYSGKFHEARVLMAENSRFAERGDPRRLLSTAAENRPDHPADLLLWDSKTGRILERYQLKLGSGQAREALREAKYAGMKIITSQEGMDEINRMLRQAEIKAARRGIGLSPYDQMIRDALRDGRLMTQLPSGASLVSRADVERQAYRWVKPLWQRLERAEVMAERAAARAVAAIGKIPGASTTLKVAGRVLIVVDYGANAYLIYSDYTRWQEGEIEGGYFAYKTSLHTAQMGLTTYALLAPDPTTVSKWVAAGLAVIVAGADMASDAIYEAGQARTRQLLSDLERDERYYHCRASIVREANHSASSLVP